MTTDTSKEAVERLLGYALHTGYEVQSGEGTKAPAVVFADADYEVGDGKIGLHENQKPANEPAIPYVRIDALVALAAENAKLREQAATVQSQRPDETDMAIWQEGYDHGRKGALEEAYNALPDAGKDTDGIDAGEGYDEAIMDAKSAIRALAEKEGE